MRTRVSYVLIHNLIVFVRLNDAKSVRDGCANLSSLVDATETRRIWMRLRRVAEEDIVRQSDGSLDLNVVYLFKGSCRNVWTIRRRPRLLRREVVSSHLTAYASGFGRHGNVESGDLRVSKLVKDEVLLVSYGFLGIWCELVWFRTCSHTSTGNAERLVGSNPGRAIREADQSIHSRIYTGGDAFLGHK